MDSEAKSNIRHLILETMRTRGWGGLWEPSEVLITVTERNPGLKRIDVHNALGEMLASRELFFVGGWLTIEE